MEKRWCAEASAGVPAGREIRPDMGRALISREIHTATARVPASRGAAGGCRPSGPAAAPGGRACVRRVREGRPPGPAEAGGPGAGFVLSWGSHVKGHLALITHLLLSGGHVRPAWGGDSPRHTDRVTLAEAAPALPQGTAVRTEGCEGLHAFWHVVGLGQPWASLGEMA